jgi:hypothetical protein
VSRALRGADVVANGAARGSEALRCGRSSFPWAFDVLRYQSQAPSPHRWTTQYLDCETAPWEGQVVTDAWTYFASGSEVGAMSMVARNGGQTSWVRTEDMIAREDEPVRYGEPGAAFASVRLMGFGLLPPRKRCECVGTGVSAHLTRVMVVFAARVRQSDVTSMRSSRKKRSSGVSPFAEHDARDFVTFEVRSLPSSRGSIRATDPGRNLFMSLQNEFIEQTLVFRSASVHAVTKGNGITHWHNT